MSMYEPILQCEYGPLDPKVNLEPDFFTGFEASRRTEIVAEEAKFYHSITAPYSVDAELEKRYLTVKAKDGYELPVKVYQPKQAGDNMPALVFFHGGGFMTCSVETHDYVPSYLAAKAKIACFSVEYRLAPEAKFPIGLEDCYTVCKWVAEHAAEFGADAEKLVVCGDSSGGNFAAVIALMAKERKDLHLWKQILIYPVTDLGGAVEKKSARVYAPVGGASESVSPMLLAYLDDPENDVKNPWVSPMLADDFTDLPSALFIEGECDSLVDDGLIYAKLLQDAGVSVECCIYKGMPHAFILRTYEETFAALNQICAFIRHNLCFSGLKPSC